MRFKLPPDCSMFVLGEMNSVNLSDFMPKMAYPLKLILLAFGSATTVGMLLIFAYSVQKASTESLTRQIGRTLAVTADEVQDAIDRTFIERYHDLSVIATQAGATRLADTNAIRDVLAQSLKLHSEFTWLGLVGADMAVISTVGDQGLGQRALQTPWLQMIASTHTSGRPGMGLLLPAQGSPEVASARSSVGLAAPVRDQSGAVMGVVVAVWDWAQPIASLTTPNHLGLEDADAFVLSKSGRILFGPANGSEEVTRAQSYLLALKTASGSVVEPGANDSKYLTGYSRAKFERFFDDIGLIVLVRQDAAVAFAPLAELKQTIFVFLLLFAAHAVAFNWVLSNIVVAPLREIASASNSLRQDNNTQIPRLTQFAEVQVLSESLISLVGELKERQDSLVVLSTSLEAKVQERTRALEELNRSLADATDTAERATAAKSRLLAAASHDLRQPLHALNLFCLALKRRVTAHDASKLVVQVEHSLASLKSMLNSLLQIAQLDVGLVSREMVPVRIRDLIEQIGTEFSIEADQRGLRFNFTSVDCNVLTDPVLFEGIIRNLISNALKFTKSGGILIAARSRGSSVLVEVYDTGPGIDSARIDSIFNEFERSSDQANGPNEGLGLGLSIVERHAKLIGAQVSVRSVVGRGSRFSVAIEKADPRATMPSSLQVQAQDRSIEGMSIMLLDDNRNVLEALRLDLLDRGATVHGFDRVARALDALHSGLVVDVAIVDYDLGDQHNGIEFCRRCRREGACFAAMILTGRTDETTLRTIAESGIPWLTKPAEPDQLVAALVRMTRTHGSAVELAAAGG